MVPLKRFLITYTFRPGHATVDEWHRHVAEFIAALAADPALGGRIRYTCMKAKDGSKYFHIAEVADDDAPKELQQRDFFKRYTEETKRVAGGEVEVVGLETIAESQRLARVPAQ